MSLVLSNRAQYVDTCICDKSIYLGHQSVDTCICDKRFSLYTSMLTHVSVTRVFNVHQSVDTNICDKSIYLGHQSIGTCICDKGV